MATSTNGLAAKARSLVNVGFGCPLCGGRTPAKLFELRNSPLLQNELARSLEEALSANCVDVAYYYCRQCHFAFNPTVDSSSVDYRGYYNDQTESLVYRRYIATLVDELATDCSLGPESTIVEIGCGSGYFLSQLKAKTGARTLLGYDPAYRGQHGMQEYVQPRLFDSADISRQIDLIVLRNCLEGLLDVEAVMRLISGPTAQQARLYVEVTDLDCILSKHNPALLFHEYYRYFSIRAMDLFLRSVGFRITKISSVFGQCYLSVLATRMPETIALDTEYRDLDAVVRQHKKVVIWGISGRSISLLSHMSWDQRVVAFGVDIDPKRQGMYIPVTGQRILSPAETIAFDPDLVIVANEIYAPEIREALGRPARFVTIQGRTI